MKKQLSKDEIEDLKEDLKKALAVKSIKDTEGGKILLKSLMQDITTSITMITLGYESMPHTRFIGEAALLKSNIDLYRAISNADDNIEFMQNLLAEALSE